MLDPHTEEIKPVRGSELHLDKTLLLPRAHLLCLLLGPNMDGHAKWSAPHVTDMQAATNHVQRGDVTHDASMTDVQEEEEEKDDDKKNEEDPRR